MRPSRAARLSLGVVIAVLLASGGAGAALLLVTPTVPASLAESSGPETVPVPFEEFADPRQVEAGFERAADVSLVSATEGLLTASACRAGESFSSGTSSLAVDGAPVLSLATATPLWRDLVKGDRGPDVRALQEELVRLGSPLVADGVLGDGSIRAIEHLLEEASGEDEQLAAIPRSRLLWIPRPTVTTASCGLSVGGPVERGSAVAVVAGGIAALRLPSVPADVLPGERRLLVDDAVLSLSPEGAVTAEADLRSFAATESARSALGTEGTTTVRAEYVLANPVRVGVVPPSALFAFEGERGCVVADGSPARVEVVSSELGRSAVVFPDGEEPASVAVLPGARSCG
ncbi:hypothetical protein MT356_00460 [Rathayibacter festucae]|uniref:peptidoglycan-binding domain-containing protein n=1 Tax=Rathayibacter festucae TaxID=110937 RepID=UPI001FB3F200|nr:hypothetical protein [Rathayibacter festucae]MCJ1698174.1 hypothetical protein [Rathayibacter festucae]